MTSTANLQVFLLDLSEESFGEPHEASFSQLDLVAHLELQHRLLWHELYPRDRRVRPTRKLVDLQLPLVEQDRVAQDADLVQRIAVLALDSREPVHEHVVQEQ